MPVEIPETITITSQNAGPTVAILAGVHGDEYEGVIAALSLARSLPKELVSGSIKIVSPAHPSAWQNCNRISPIDGANLARVFPGSKNGSATEQLAHAITEQVIKFADVLIDLHSAGTNFEMPFLCGFHAGSHNWCKESERLANVFNADFTWHHNGEPDYGRSLTVAYEQQIPAIYIEGHGGRSIRRTDLDGYTDGVRRVLQDLKMLSAAPQTNGNTIQVIGSGNTDAGLVASVDGYLVTHVKVGDRVSTGEVIAEIIDISGVVLMTLCATQTCYIMLFRRDAKVSTGDTICITAKELR
jgi:predicted deacylase